MAPSRRVLIAHPDPLARAYMRDLTESHLRHADTLQADSFDTLLAQLRDNSGIVLAIVDSSLLGVGCEFGLLAEHYPDVRVAVMFSTLDQDKFKNLATDRVAALIPTQVPEASLVEILGGILDEASHLPETVPHSALPVDPTDTPHTALEHEFTGRQRDVMRLLSHGHSNREIAEMLGIAEGTVKVHVNAAFRLLRVHNRVSAAVACREYFETD